MKFTSPLIAVKSVEVSKKFYGDLFEQKVILDFGKNVTFSGGFAIQEDFDVLCGFPRDSMIQKSNNMELYFEVEDFDAFIKKLEARTDIEYVTRPKKYDWQQRVVRIYDPDYHIIEIGESMAVIVRRLLGEGKTTEEVMKLTMHPLEFIEAARNNQI